MDRPEGLSCKFQEKFISYFNVVNVVNVVAEHSVLHKK